MKTLTLKLKVFCILQNYLLQTLRQKPALICTFLSGSSHMQAAVLKRPPVALTECSKYNMNFTG